MARTFPSNVLRSETLLFAGAAILAFHPALWLVRTWTEPAYDSSGAVAAVLAAAMAVWSLSSPRRADRLRRAAPRLSATGSRSAGVCLVAAATLFRLAGQVLGVNVVAAGALVLDVWALGLLGGLGERRRPVSAGWLALLFACSFPFGFLVRRTIGFGLQSLSAAGAASLLGMTFDTVGREGVRLLVEGHEILVDLPCSGASGLFVALLSFTTLATLVRPTATAVLLGGVATLGGALVANVLRITAIAAGTVAGLPLLESPWHETTGIAVLGLGLLPVFAWARAIGRSRFDAVRQEGAETNVQREFVAPAKDGVPSGHLLRIPAPAPASDPGSAGTTCFSRLRVGRRLVTTEPRRRTKAARRLPSWRTTGSVAFFGLAALILALPARPLDVAAASAPPSLPLQLDGQPLVPMPLGQRERAYFVRYGGGAARGRYGAHEVLRVRTSAPLRHLHSPDECLAGSGHAVRYLGVTPSGRALYRTIAPDGRKWRVEVVFVSDRGEVATQVGEAVWSWLLGGGGAWTMTQHVAPWSASSEDTARFSHALARALELPVNAEGAGSDPSTSRPGTAAAGGRDNDWGSDPKRSHTTAAKGRTNKWGSDPTEGSS